MRRMEFSTPWNLSLSGGVPPETLPSSIPATVPGTVHTDLLAAGLIPDPYLDLNELSVQWIAETDAIYSTIFDAPASSSTASNERIDLVCGGLDTIATVELNGRILGKTKNQHRSYRFDVTDALQPTGNELRVQFDSALRYVREAQSRLGDMPYIGNAYPYNAVRKMACNFGWDWGPALITAGIWKPMWLETWSTGRIASTRPVVTVDEAGSGHIELDTVVEFSGSGEDAIVVATLRSAEGEVVSSGEATARLGVSSAISLSAPDVNLWWPRGYGEQPLYSLEVELHDGDRTLDSVSRTIGFRTVEVRLADDEFGTGFSFHVNGQFVYIKGANWIPDDCFLPRVTADRYARSIADACAADMNLLRVWGGGIYESEDFYSECDRLGILVWQDFPFACATYSELPELWDEVEAEARENIVRLMSHPSLVMWNGGNENVEGYYFWGWKEKLDPKLGWGDGYYRTLLPRLLAELDPTHAYIPTSPYNPVDYSDPRDPERGPVHNWEVWNRVDYRCYRSTIPRFVAEFGFQGPPTYATIQNSIHDDPLESNSPGMTLHQKAGGGNEKLNTGFAGHLPVPRTFDDWHATTQLNQARAITYAIEHFRSYAPRTAGSIIWQLNDCWPVSSWAAVDGEKRRKPLWYALRAVNAAHLLTIQPRPEGLSLVICNDDGAAWEADIEVTRITFGGRELAAQRVKVSVPAHSNVEVSLVRVLEKVSDPSEEVLVAVERAGTSRRAFWYFAEDVNLNIPPFDAHVDVVDVDGGVSVEVTASGFVKDLVLNPDRLDPDARAEEMFVTLFPGEMARIRVTTARDLDFGALTRHPVLTSVNHLLHPQP